eukprot:10190357-Alexandrium_andersonii.AAC.1
MVSSRRMAAQSRGMPTVWAMLRTIIGLSMSSANRASTLSLDQGTCSPKNTMDSLSEGHLRIPFAAGSITCYSHGRH